MYDIDLLAALANEGEAMRLLELVDVQSHDSRYGMSLNNSP